MEENHLKSRLKRKKSTVEASGGAPKRSPTPSSYNPAKTGGWVCLQRPLYLKGWENTVWAVNGIWSARGEGNALLTSRVTWLTEHCSLNSNKGTSGLFMVETFPAAAAAARNKLSVATTLACRKHMMIIMINIWYMKALWSNHAPIRLFALPVP